MSSPHQSVPPAKSSHISDDGSDTGRSTDPAQPPRAAKIIRVPQLAYLGVLVLLFCVFFPFVGWPIALWWLLLIPVAVAVWIYRTRTTVSEAGLDLRTVFGTRHLEWSQVAGVTIPKRGFVRAHLTDDSDVKLPAVSYDRLRDLIDASGGRIPDLFAAEAAAWEAKVATEKEKAEAERAEAKDVAAEPADTDTDSTATKPGDSAE
ncbi:PH domain-containing protein [Nocardia sp. NPDC051463]|uniref:PH domain-containing protein n=1 Tax=Nocardia sp. NPDC051463 TaxID=3154845 RepID=UPI0034335B0B